MLSAGNEVAKADLLSELLKEGGENKVEGLRGPRPLPDQPRWLRQIARAPEKISRVTRCHVSSLQLDLLENIR